ncbi:MAG: LysM domain-containing protein [Byssovorax sp.]
MHDPRPVRVLTSAALVMAAIAAIAAPSSTALGFPHVVKPGETLAQIAERTYGRVEMEQVLVAENGLDAGGGIPIVPGMRLEIPALGYRRAAAGDTWASLALELLGDEKRDEAFAAANGSMPWLNPADGQELIVPYNLRYVAGPADSLLTIAYRFLGQRDKAWMLDRYNRRKGQSLQRGEVVLVPLGEITLTPEGKAEAASAGTMVRAEGAGQARSAQRKVEVELPQLAADLRAGRYVDAVARGNRMLGYGELSRPEIASIQQKLTEAYVALDAIGLAETACGAWREADPAAVLDPVEISPKILRACTSAARPREIAPATVPVPGAASVPPQASAPPRPRRERGR